MRGLMCPFVPLLFPNDTLNTHRLTPPQVQVVSLVTWLIDGLEGMPTISYSRSQWIFALAAALEKPIHCDTGAALR